MRRLRIVLAGIVIVAVGLIVAAAAIISNIDVNEYRGDIASAVKGATGRDLTIDGEMDLEISLEPAVVVEDVSFANPPDMSRPAMATLKRLEARVELLPLLTGDIRVRYVVLEGLDLLLERNAAGAENWVLGGEAAPAPEPSGSGARLPVVQEMRLRDVTVAYLDGASGERQALSLESVDLAAESGSSPMAFAARGRLQNLPFSAEGQLPSVASLTDGAAFPLNVAVAIAGVALKVDGAFAQPRDGKGLSLVVTATSDELAASLRSLAELEPAMASMPMPETVGPLSLSVRIEGSLADLSASDLDLSAGSADTLRIALQGGVEHLARGEGLDLRLTVEGRDLSGMSGLAGGEMPADKPFSLSGRLSDGDGAYGIDGLSVTAGDSALSGWATATMKGPRPKVEAQFLADLIDLADLPLPAAPPEAPIPPGERLFSGDPLRIDAMKAVDADIDFQAKKIVVGNLELTNVASTLVLVDGRLNASPLKATLAGGQAEGAVVLDGSSGPQAKLAIDMTASGVEAGRLARDLAGEDLLTGGPMDVRVRLDGAGDSERALVASLNGEVRVSVGNGRISNKGLDALGGDIGMQALNALNPFAGQETHTNLNCGAVRFVVGDGKAVADRGIAAETSNVNVVGSGAIDLRTEGIDFTIKPEAREGLGLNIGGVASIVRVTGTLAQPGVGLDALEAGKKALSVGAAIATGGVSLLAEGLLNRVTADAEPCRTALGLAASGRPARKSGSPAPAPSSSQGGVKGLLDGFGRSLNDTLRGR